MRWAATGLAALLVAWLWLLVPVSSPYQSWIGPVSPVPELPKPWPQSLELAAAREVRDRFPPGSTLARVLQRAGVPSDRAHSVVTAAGSAIDLRRIRDGQRYRLYFDEQDQLQAMRYEIDRTNAWVVSLRDGEWATEKVTIPVRTKPVFISATIVSSLDRALAPYVPDGAAGNDLILRIADLYSWDVDFNYELRIGDRIDLVVLERYVEDEMIGYGDVLAAEFRVGRRTIPVVRYADDRGSASYYAPGGTSLRRTFLRSPVKYTRISSRFSYRRVHPVTGIARAHRGVDYVADPGTPVQATAAGVIVEAGYAPEAGRYVKIRHGGSYSSIYMHFSRFGAGAKVGVEVKQGDIVGYVGKSGNATGYHLHYGLLQGGRYVDPIDLQFPAAEPVPETDWAAFRAQRDQWIDELRQGQAQLDVAIAGGGGA